MLTRLGLNGAAFLGALFVIGCSKAGAPTTRQSELTPDNKAAKPPETPSEALPPYHREYRLYETGQLAQARLALLQTVREETSASIAMGTSRRIDLETKLGIGVLANCVSHCIDLERKHGRPDVFPQELREAARTTMEALDAVVRQVRDLCRDDERLVSQLAYVHDRKARLLMSEIGALQAAGETEEATTLAQRYAGFWRSRGTQLGEGGIPVACKPGAAPLSTTKGSQAAAPSADGEARRTEPADQNRKGNDRSETETSFWKTLADGNTEALKGFYAGRVALKAGSELLKPRWGIASDRGRDATLARNKLMAGYARMIGEFGREKWRRAFSKIGEDDLAVTLIAEPNRPFPGTRKGDRLLTVGTGERDDRLFYVFRRQGTEWRIVIEVTDY